MSQLYTPQLYGHNHADHNALMAPFAVTIQAKTAWVMNKQALVIWAIPIPAQLLYADHDYTGSGYTRLYRP